MNRKVNNSIKNIALVVLVGAVLAVPLFASAAIPPTVVTYQAADITLDSAKLKGAVIRDGGCAAMTAWFQYGSDTSYGSNTSQVKRTTTGAFSATISDLSSCNTYHFRAITRGNGGTSYGSDKVLTTKCPSFDARVSVKNLSREDTIWYESLWAEPFSRLLFRIKLHSTGDAVVQGITLENELPPNVIYKGNLIIKDVRSSEDISRGAVAVGNLLPGGTKIITFEAQVGSEAGLDYGRNNLINTVLAYTSEFSDIGSCKIMVIRGGVAPAAADTTGGDTGAMVNGAPSTVSATQIGTGVTTDVLGSILLPLMIAFLLVWTFKSKLIGFDRWTEKRKKEIDEHRAKRKLKRMIKRFR